MKSKCLLLITVFFSSHSAIALPSSYNLIPGSSRGRDLDNRLTGYVSERDLFGRDDPAVCTTASCQKCDKCDPLRCRVGYYRDKSDCKCKKCAVGQRPNPLKTGCIPDSKQPDNTPDDKGKCPNGKVLDPAEGGQDKNTNNPKCLPDDKCAQGSVPTSRQKDDADGKGKATCVTDSKEADKPKCASNEYRFVTDAGGKAKYECRKTRKFDKEKESKFEDAKKRKKDERKKKEDDKKKKEEEDKKKKEEEQKKKDEEKKDRKKERMGKCMPLVSLSMGYPEDGFPQATDFFSEEYIDSEDIMSHWPSGLDDVPSANIDTDEYVDEFLKAMDDLTWIPWGGGGGKRRDVGPSVPEIIPATSTDIAIVPRETGLIVRHEKRFVKALFTAIKSFFVRIGSWLGRAVNRLQALKNKGGPRIAEKGKGAKYADQKKAGDNIAKDKNWDNCIYGKKPEKVGPGS